MEKMKSLEHNEGEKWIRWINVVKEKVKKSKNGKQRI